MFGEADGLGGSLFPTRPVTVQVREVIIFRPSERKQGVRGGQSLKPRAPQAPEAKVLQGGHNELGGQAAH